MHKEIVRRKIKNLASLLFKIVLGTEILVSLHIMFSSNKSFFNYLYNLGVVDQNSNLLISNIILWFICPAIIFTICFALYTLSYLPNYLFHETEITYSLIDEYDRLISAKELSKDENKEINKIAKIINYHFRQLRKNLWNKNLEQVANYIHQNYHATDVTEVLENLITPEGIPHTKEFVVWKINDLPHFTFRYMKSTTLVDLVNDAITIDIIGEQDYSGIFITMYSKVKILRFSTRRFWHIKNRTNKSIGLFLRLVKSYRYKNDEWCKLWH